MPHAAPRPCTIPGCAALTNTGRCVDHPRPPWKPGHRKRDTRPSASQRGYGKQHRLLRAQILARDPLCQICERAAATEADHITPRSQGGSQWDPSNMQGLCKSCHSKKTWTDGSHRAK